MKEPIPFAGYVEVDEMNKPVAWMLKTGHGTKILEVKPYCEVDLWTPLYLHPANACKHGVDDGACKECYLEATHPVKELTDEEIAEVYEKCEWSSGYVYWKEFARAILRKAQSNCNGFCGEYECKENKGGGVKEMNQQQLAIPIQ